MEQWQHGGGVSLDASVGIVSGDQCGRERLLRYCARPPYCAGEMRIIAFVTDRASVQAILVHIGEPTRPPSPARDPPAWAGDGDASEVIGSRGEPVEIDPLVHPEPG